MNEGNKSKKGKIRYVHNLILEIPYPMKDTIFLYQTRALKLLDKEGLT